MSPHLEKLWIQLMRDSSRSTGFTLIEVVVVVAIVGILLGLGSVGLQAARERSRATECMNRVRQLGLGMQLFHGRMNSFPGNGGHAADSQILSTSGILVTPFTRDIAAGSGDMKWGVGQRGRGTRDQTGPWAYSILPMIERANEQASDAFHIQLPDFRCPSRDRGGDPLPPRTDLYGVYESGGHAMGKTDYAANQHVILNRPNVMSFHNLVDGTSTTILIGEKAFDPTVQTPTSWYWDEPIWIGGSLGTARQGRALVTDGIGISFRDRWGAAHPGLVHFVFADGHVDSLTTSIDGDLMGKLLAPGDGEQVSLEQ